MFKKIPAIAFALLSSVFSVQSANATVYSVAYTATAPSFSLLSGTGDVGATLDVGDSLTVTVNAPANKAFKTTGGFIFNYQMWSGSSELTEDATYDFSLGGLSVLSGTVNNAAACCSDVRLPIYSLPPLTWDTLTFTATIVSANGPVQLLNMFVSQQNNTQFIDTAAVPEPAPIALMAIGALGFAQRRRQRGKQATLA
ncbi:PEP-CTERM sorting domain-containing protein [Massilia sp. NEAU-DD11]|uniref:PEP-CTERM sorting domain-containing protein n=1 Tax=Massilia cellulosiltytica TaxID=2683234 RepID=A0A7X3K5W8_9BURK|nr:PEP-CTERM sorting domain-containing protein [Telluria cellulosilytica]MVW58610.1 PEP-CTERM sorting domain-containing protein [Telluria cellulosilytica]